MAHVVRGEWWVQLEVAVNFVDEPLFDIGHCLLDLSRRRATTEMLASLATLPSLGSLQLSLPWWY